MNNIVQKLSLSAELRALKKDKKFAEMAKRFPVPELRHSRNAFRSLAHSIIYQQLSGKAAATIEKRFVALYRPKKFPQPEDVLNTSMVELRSVGLSGQKSAYILDLAQKFKDKSVVPKHFHLMSDSEISEHIISVKGIGQWTADMFLIFALNRPDVLPTGDLAIQKGAQIFFSLKTMPKPEKIRTLAKPYAGHHTVLSLYLWKLADEAKIKK